MRCLIFVVYFKLIIEIVSIYATRATKSTLSILVYPLSLYLPGAERRTVHCKQHDLDLMMLDSSRTRHVRSRMSIQLARLVTRLL